MYTDVFVLDQCRYMYDLVPTLALFGDGLPHTLQLQLRICMNLIRLHTHESCPCLYLGSALAGMEVKGQPFQHGQKFGTLPPQWNSG